MNETTKSHILLHAVVVIFGFTGILGKLISIEAIPLVFWRTTIGGLVILAWLAIRKQITKKSRSTILKMSGVGLLVASHWILFFASIKASTVSVALAMVATTPMFVGLIEPIVFNRKLDWKEIFVSAIVIVGISTIFKISGEYYLGMILGLASALLAGLFATFNGVLVKTYDASNISMIELLSASLGITLLLACTGGIDSDLFILSSSDWLWISILAVVATSFAFIASTSVMKVLTPFTTAIAINLEPVYAIILAVVFFGDEEVMGVEFYLGASLIIGAVIINTLIKREKAR
ncbi:MAG: DMT family transporter [Bacteroidota bacterium]|nr:DMT family transporter [Bacteroidota bacterium]